MRLAHSHGRSTMIQARASGARFAQGMVACDFLRYRPTVLHRQAVIEHSGCRWPRWLHTSDLGCRHEVIVPRLLRT